MYAESIQTLSFFHILLRYSLILKLLKLKKKKPPGWSVPPETLSSRPGSVAAGRDWEVHGATHNWPCVVRVREGLPGRDILVSLRIDFCGGPGAVHAD